MNIEPIGIVKSPVIEAIDENWDEVISEIHIFEPLSAGLKGLESFSHALIIFYMHKTTFMPERHLIRHPQERKDMPKIGIFAQRAKHRPNPIGLTAVQIISVEDNILKVKGLDAINETPVLDIKPYFPIFDKVDNAETPEWVEELMEGYF